MIMDKNNLLLQEAVIKNDLESVRKILKTQQVDVNCKDMKFGRSPLEWACSKGNPQIISLLINSNADVESNDKFGMRPLMMCAWYGHVSCLELLINAGSCVNARNARGETALACAVKNEKLNAVVYLLDSAEGAAIDDVSLRCACTLGNVAVAAEIVRRAASACNDWINDKYEEDGRTPLHVACEKGHVGVVELLLDYGARADEQDGEGFTPLHLAVINEKKEVLDTLLKTKADPNLENHKGLAPLHTAAVLKSTEIIQKLVENGASISRSNKLGNTPLHLCCQKNDATSVDLLISKNADLNVLNCQSQSPLHVCCELGHTQICRSLLMSGAAPDLEDKGGRSAIFLAARAGHAATVDTIIKFVRGVEGDGRRCDSFKDVFYILAYQVLKEGEWKQLARLWLFTDQQISIIEEQYTGETSYKEHGFRMLLIWGEGLAPESNPVRIIYETLISIDRKKTADIFRRKLDERVHRNKGKAKKSYTCCSIN